MTEQRKIESQLETLIDLIDEHGSVNCLAPFQKKRFYDLTERWQELEDNKDNRAMWIETDF